MDGITTKVFASYLLRGINVIDNPLLDRGDIKNKNILDEEKLGKPWFVAEDNSSTNYDVWVEESAYDLARSYVDKLGLSKKYKLFGMSANLNADHTEEVTQNIRYGLISAINSTNQFSTKITTDVLRNCLSEKFANDLKFATDKNIENVFDTYGTHLITKFSVGGKMDISFTTKPGVIKKKDEIKTEALRAFGFFANGGSDGTPQDISSFTSDCIYRIAAVGGDLSTVPRVLMEGDGYKTWAESVLKQPDIYEIENLIPIWELISNKTQQDKFKEKYNELYKNSLKQLANKLPCIYKLRIDVRDDDKVDSNKTEEEYVAKFDAAYGGGNADCNSTTGGKKVYILYEYRPQTYWKALDISMDYRERAQNKASAVIRNCPNVDEISADSETITLPESLNTGEDANYDVYISYEYGISENEHGYQAMGVRNTAWPFNRNWNVIRLKDGEIGDMNKGTGGKTESLFLFAYRDPFWGDYDALEKISNVADENII